MDQLLFFSLFLGVVGSLSVFGYAVWILFLFPKYILPHFHLSTKKIQSWKKYLVFILPAFGWFGCWLAAPLIIAFIKDQVINTHVPPPAVFFSTVLFVAASVFLGITAIPYAFFRLILKVTKRSKQFVQVDAILAVLTFLTFTLGGSLILQNVLESYGSAQASNFFILNAAIKNTCFMDPKRIGCPHNLTELSYIEPGEFARLSPVSQMIYQYYPDQNMYTFIARYSKKRAIIFDWRLVPTDKIDFRDVTIETWGKDHVKNPPNFPGPWDNLPEWDK